MTLVSAIIFLALFATFIAGVFYVACRLRDALEKIDGTRKQQEHDASSFVQQLSVEDRITVSNILASAEPLATLSNLVAGQTFTCTVEFSTNLVEWEAYTNFTASLTNWDLSLPQQTNRGPMGFYRITTWQ